MTYYNGNPHAGPTLTAPLDKFAHDGCLPESEFEVVMLDDFTTGRTNPATGFRVYDKVAHRHQRWPWHWSPVWGAPKSCYVCGGAVK